MKVFGVGLNKTGTTTLGECLAHWGFRHISCSEAAFNLWREGNIAGLIEMAANFDSFEDWPWPLVYRELDAAFPGSKFILTTRGTPDIWFRSLCNHAVKTGPTEFRKAIYGEYMPHGHKKTHVALYEAHNQGVLDYFKGRTGDFIEVSWEKGDGWEILGNFLNLPVPNIQFPHANKGEFTSQPHHA